jgi:hypothetical protein
MYSRLVTAFATVAAVAMVAPIQAQEVHLVAHVPFDFSIGNSTLPRDTYNLTRLAGHPEMLLIRGDRKSAFVRTDEVRLSQNDATPSLVFHRFGDQYFLRQIRWEGSSRLDLPETNAEREAADSRATRIGSRMETVVIAAGQR